MNHMDRIRLGYIRLCDAAPLIVAQCLDYFVDEGLAVELLALPSWAEVRDGLMMGELHASHCLAGIPIAGQAGLFGPNAKLATALTLNHHGNVITLAPELAAELEDHDPSPRGLTRLAKAWAARGRPLVLASVFPVSKHEYELRHWLRSGGLDPDEDMRLVVVPPPRVAAALQTGSIDGFCAGEPWGSLAVAEGAGEIVMCSSALGLPGTEKVLAVREEWLEHPSHLAVLRALRRALQWLNQPVNRRTAAELLAPYLDLPAADILPALNGEVAMRPVVNAGRHGDFLRFADPRLSRPDPAHARWLLEQMHKAGQLGAGPADMGSAERAFRPDIHDLALAG